MTISLDGEAVELTPDDVSLRVRPQQGFAVSREGGEVVALDLALDDELRLAVWPATSCASFRTCARRAGSRSPTGSGCISSASTRLAAHFDFIAREVLAVDIVSGPGEGEGTLLDLEDELVEGPVFVWIERVDNSDS